MARPSSSNSSHGSPQEKHEVFISFRGEDTRKTFTSHLNAALTRRDIKTYIDDYNLVRGDEISAALLSAIEDAKVSVIVFSENYANSSWCLNELIKILECKKWNGQIVVPVFYGIDPSSVRYQRGSLEHAFAKHEDKLSDNMEKVQRWRDALKEVADLLGWDCSGRRTDYEMVEDIATGVLRALERVYVGDLDYKIARLAKLAELQEEYSQQIDSLEIRKNHQATLQRIVQLKMEKKSRMFGLSTDLLAHTEILRDTDKYLSSKFHPTPSNYLKMTENSELINGCGVAPVRTMKEVAVVSPEVRQTEEDRGDHVVNEYEARGYYVDLPPEEENREHTKMKQSPTRSAEKK